MKKFLPILILSFVLSISSQVLAAKVGGCAALVAQTVCQGEPVTLRGTLVGMIAGEGLVFESDNGEKISLCGLGPAWYWRKLGVQRPRLGDQIEIMGYRLELQNGQKIVVAREIRLADGTLVTLRDQDCYPEWLKR